MAYIKKPEGYQYSSHYSYTAFLVIFQVRSIDLAMINQY